MQPISLLFLRTNPRLVWLGRLLPMAAAVLLAGCATSPDFQHPEPVATSAYTATAVPGETVASPGRLGASQKFVDASVSGQWWTAFESDKLTALIELAHASSPTLAAVQATLRQAQHSFEATAGATQLPQVNAKLGGQRQGTNTAAAGLPGGERSYGLYSATVALSYDLDLAGGNKRALEALAAQVDYQSYQLEGARMNLAANLTLTAITQAQLSAQIGASEDAGRRAAGTTGADAPPGRARCRHRSGGVVAADPAAAVTGDLADLAQASRAGASPAGRTGRAGAGAVDGARVRTAGFHIAGAVARQRSLRTGTAPSRRTRVRSTAAGGQRAARRRACQAVSAIDAERQPGLASLDGGQPVRQRLADLGTGRTTRAAAVHAGLEVPGQGRRGGRAGRTGQLPANRAAVAA